MNFFIVLGFVSLIVLATPFVLKNEKKYFIAYVWISFGFLLFSWGQDYYWEYTHPTANSGIGAAFGHLIFFVITLATVIPIVITIIWKNLFTYVFKGFIVPLIILFIPVFILFQGFLLFSAYKAHNSAKQMQTTNISRKNMLDFYSPFIKHISVEAGESKRWYRWSYRRGRYVFEVNQYDTYIPDSESNHSTIYHFPHNQYTKEYKLSIPKAYLAKRESRHGLEEMIIPSDISWSHYFDFTKNHININASKNNTIEIAADERMGKQFGLQKTIHVGYYYGDDGEKYGNRYLTYFNKTVFIQCHYLANDTTLDTCHMKMLVNGFEYKFDIFKKYIPEWKQINTRLSALFESFIEDAKIYPEALNPYKE